MNPQLHRPPPSVDDLPAVTATPPPQAALASESVSSTAPGAPTKDEQTAILALYRLSEIDRDENLVAQLREWHRSFIGDQPRFVLNRRLGEGSQGIIYSLYDRDCRREVALKTLRASRDEHLDLSRFMHEAQITAQLEHPGIVPVHDFGVLTNGTLFYTMKRIEGQSLAEHLKLHAAVPASRFDLLELFIRICEPVAFAHSRGVVHRDLKPRNVMLGSYGEVLVIDWGLAKLLGSPSRDRLVSTCRSTEGDDNDTADGLAVGTPAYMSPEQARGSIDQVDQRSDVYSLGIILYEMLVGSSPYQRGNPTRTLEQVVGGSWARLEQHPVGRRLPKRLRAIVHKAMAYHQQDRYQTVDALVHDLHDALAGRAVSAYHESPVEWCVRTITRHRKQLLLAVATIAVTAGVLLGGRALRPAAPGVPLAATSASPDDWRSRIATVEAALVVHAGDSGIAYLGQVVATLAQDLPVSEREALAAHCRERADQAARQAALATAEGRHGSAARFSDLAEAWQRAMSGSPASRPRGRPPFPAQDVRIKPLTPLPSADAAAQGEDGAIAAPPSATRARSAER